MTQFAAVGVLQRNGKTIQQVIECYPGYLTNWAFTEKTGNLLDNSPALVASLRALPNDYLNTQPSLRAAMERNDTYPRKLSTSSIVAG
ncbi:hypothetical protein EJ02DRAFT_454566 [Clathrospora elynae]|uniref:Uncharacterized protein n=1 Tax=Clathrospora elynae TaxID=706981 RepID=A0A6A5SN42_9PLEO|nr:hypothetical protein EJ02DRAFT_454566 [Clathrospora elynae]